MRRVDYYLLIVTVALSFSLVPQVLVPIWQEYLGYSHFVDHKGYWVNPVFEYSSEQIIYSNYTSTGVYRAQGNHVLYCWEFNEPQHLNNIYSWQFDEWSYPVKINESVGSFRLSVPESAVGHECIWKFHVWIDTGRAELSREFFTNSFFVVDSV